MLIEQILGYSTDDLEKLVKENPEECHRLLDPYLQYTRPERTDMIPEKKSGAKKKVDKAIKEVEKKLSQRDELEKLMKMAGMDTTVLKPKQEEPPKQ
jgi:hypothetical protein